MTKLKRMDIAEIQIEEEIQLMDKMLAKWCRAIEKKQKGKVKEKPKKTKVAKKDISVTLQMSMLF